jgi:hypothetical protein
MIDWILIGISIGIYLSAVVATLLGTYFGR